MKSHSEISPLCVRNSNNTFFSFDSPLSHPPPQPENTIPPKRLKTEPETAKIEQILCEEQDACIEIRDVGSAIARVAKAAITDGSSPNLIQELNAKVQSLQDMIKSIEGIYNKKKEAGCETCTQVDLLKEAQRLPLLTRPRRFRKQNKKITPPSTPVEDPAAIVNGKRKACTLCGATHSPEWRKGPAGSKTLCNACGLHYAKVLKQEGRGGNSGGSPSFTSYSPPIETPDNTQVANNNNTNSNSTNGFFVVKGNFNAPNMFVSNKPCNDQFFFHNYSGYPQQYQTAAPHTGHISVTQLLN